FRGDPPTHPELLDYLAVRFVESGWSLKKLHRLIMTSAAYRQASADNETARRIDPENQLLWRMNRRRLEIECVRDFHARCRRPPGPHGRWCSVFADSGTLDTAPLGLRFHRARPHSGSAERVRLRFTGSACALALCDDRSPAGALLPEQPVHRGTVARPRGSSRDCRRLD